MPTIRPASLVRAPKPKPRGKFRQMGDKAKAAANGPGVRGAKGKARSFTGNRTSKPGTRAAFGPKTKYGSKKAGSFGSLSSGDKHDRSVNRGLKMGAYGQGALIGGIGAMSVADGASRQRTAQIRSNRQKIARNRKKLEVGKAFRRTHLITDVGTKAQRYENRAYAGRGLGRAGAAGIATGAGLLTAGYVAGGKKQKKIIRAQKATLASQQKKLQKNMSVSAFGVDHG